jgi:hypothetical protein
VGSAFRLGKTAFFHITPNILFGVLSPEVYEILGAPPPRGGAVSHLRGSQVVCTRNIFIFNAVWKQNKMYILVGTLLSWNNLLITCLVTVLASNTLCRQLKWEKCVILYLNFMSYLIIWIDSGGEGRDVHETYWGGGQCIKYWEPLLYAIRIGSYTDLSFVVKKTVKYKANVLIFCHYVLCLSRHKLYEVELDTLALIQIQLYYQSELIISAVPSSAAWGSVVSQNSLQMTHVLYLLTWHHLSDPNRRQSLHTEVSLTEEMS